MYVILQQILISNLKRRVTDRCEELAATYKCREYRKTSDKNLNFHREYLKSDIHLDSPFLTLIKGILRDEALRFPIG
jgi:hypothetical protein